jgi:hypothetical protein
MRMFTASLRYEGHGRFVPSHSDRAQIPGGMPPRQRTHAVRHGTVHYAIHATSGHAGRVIARHASAGGVAAGRHHG